MKGFPNQIADLGKIAVAIHTLERLRSEGQNPRDDGIFGVELVRARVAGTGHTPKPVAEYIREQLRKKPSNQSFRTTARGLRELFRLFGLTVEKEERIQLTELGRQAATFAGTPLNAPQIAFWRRIIRNMIHAEPNDEVSHPYQVLLRLVAAKPGIIRAKCALALEARNDSTAELNRIVALADQSERQIRTQTHVSKSNWDNAKKVLPKFAEQLGDVVRTGQSYVLATAPGGAIAQADEAPISSHSRRPAVPRAPRASRQVTPDSIGRAGTVEQFDEMQITQDVNPKTTREAVQLRLNRLRRHNEIVRALARRLSTAGATLYEDPFDVLALIRHSFLLIEVKSLDGTSADERDRVQEALAQLLYYEAFVAAPIAGENLIKKIACFEGSITIAHQQWLNAAGIGTLWGVGGDKFAADELGRRFLRNFLEELR